MIFIFWSIADYNVTFAYVNSFIKDDKAFSREPAD